MAESKRNPRWRYLGSAGGLLGALVVVLALLTGPLPCASGAPSLFRRPRIVGSQTDNDRRRARSPPQRSQAPGTPAKHDDLDHGGPGRPRHSHGSTAASSTTTSSTAARSGAASAALGAADEHRRREHDDEHRRRGRPGRRVLGHHAAGGRTLGWLAVHLRRRVQRPVAGYVELAAPADQHQRLHDRRRSRSGLLRRQPPDDFRVRRHAQPLGRADADPTGVRADADAVRRRHGQLVPDLQPALRLLRGPGQAAGLDAGRLAGDAVAVPRERDPLRTVPRQWGDRLRRVLLGVPHHRCARWCTTRVRRTIRTRPTTTAPSRARRPLGSSTPTRCCGPRPPSRPTSTACPASPTPTRRTSRDPTPPPRPSTNRSSWPSPSALGVGTDSPVGQDMTQELPATTSLDWMRVWQYG